MTVLLLETFETRSPETSHSTFNDVENHLKLIKIFLVFNKKDSKLIFFGIQKTAPSKQPRTKKIFYTRFFDRFPYNAWAAWSAHSDFVGSMVTPKLFGRDML